VEDAKAISVLVEGELTVNEQYILIGEVVERKSNGEKTLIFSATLAHNVNSLDVVAFKDALELGRRVEDNLSR
jgi:hypothetical protein